MQIKRFIRSTIQCGKSHCKKEKKIFEKKLKECIGKPKDLRKAIKSFVLPNKSDGCIAEALLENQIVKHDTKSVLKTFKVLFKPGREFISKTSEVAKSIYN